MGTIELEVQESKPFDNDMTFKTAHIALNSWTEGSNGQIYLSPECRTASEIEFYANELIEELQRLIKLNENFRSKVWE